MNILRVLQQHLGAALAPLVDDPSDLVEMVRATTDPKFGDYQLNCAMPLGRRLGRPPREIATEIAERLELRDMCEPPEIAGPGFINLRLRDDWLLARLADAKADEDRLGTLPSPAPRSYVVDYSAPNVAKPMHVGHIRSTVIGAALARILRFQGHRVVTDNHIGDWGTQFGMILYGYKNLRDDQAYKNDPVAELGRLYRLVQTIVTYHASLAELPEALERLGAAEKEFAATSGAPPPVDKGEKKKAAKALKRQESNVKELRETVAALREKIASVQRSADLLALAEAHADAANDALAETARLHAGDEENLRLWKEFLPECLKSMQTIYDRLEVSFDAALGESFYHDRLAGVVEDLRRRGLAVESEGAICVFLEGFDQPMIVQKRDGAFLYATTDLATVAYRAERWNPDAILYVVDHRQSLHFEQLFAAARRWGYDRIELVHVSFGTVLGKDKRPFRTREGLAVGLSSLLDEAERRAREIVAAGDDAKPDGPELSETDRDEIARVVGIGALKYADLSQNRTSDYEFSYEKMLATEGNTATYMQYAYARVRSIFRRGKIDIDALRRDRSSQIVFTHPAERALGLCLLGLSDALELVLADCRPNQLTAYLFDLATRYSTFYQNCPVLAAEHDATRTSRLLLCDLTARTLRLGLSLLGINVVEQM